ncbi:hypothetical protein, partial [Azospirillum himalayense]
MIKNKEAAQQSGLFGLQDPWEMAVLRWGINPEFCKPSLIAHYLQTPFNHVAVGSNPTRITI